MNNDNSHIEEIFVDPEYALKRPNEVIFKFAFNEKGDLGLITAYQDVGNDTVFTGISLSFNGVWVCKSPLAIKANIDAEALQNIARIFSPASEHPEPKNAAFEQFIKPPARIFSAGSFVELLKALDNLKRGNPHPFEEEKYFGQPDFSNLSDSSKFGFNMDSFLDAFDAKDIEDKDSPEDSPEDVNDDPDGLG